MQIILNVQKSAIFLIEFINRKTKFKLVYNSGLVFSVNNFMNCSLIRHFLFRTDFFNN